MNLKNEISIEPSVEEFVFNIEDLGTAFIVVASDGLWDVYSDVEVQKFVL